MSGSQLAILVPAVVALITAIAALIQAYAASMRSHKIEGQASATTEVHQGLQTQITALQSRVNALDGGPK